MSKNGKEGHSGLSEEMRREALGQHKEPTSILIEPQCGWETVSGEE